MNKTPVRIGVAGISGRVGRLLAEEISLLKNATLVGGTALSKDIDQLREKTNIFDKIEPLIEKSDVIIDFTNAVITQYHAEALRNSGVAWILGTTGITPETQIQIDETAKMIPVVQSANFSPGVTLITRLAMQLAKALPAEQYDAEILEIHHRQKVDAPSGTALAIGEAIAEGRGVDLSVVREINRQGFVGARKEGTIGFASLRGGQIVGEHSAMFISDVERITLTHEAFERRIFAKGAIRSAFWAVGKPNGLYGMGHVLGLDEYKENGK